MAKAYLATEEPSARSARHSFNSLRFKLVALPLKVLLGLLFYFAALGIHDLQSSLETAQMEQSSFNSQLAAFEINERLQRCINGLIAAAASSLKSQAQDLVGTVAVFKFESVGGANVAPRVAAPTYTPARVPITTRLALNLPAVRYRKWS